MKDLIQPYPEVMHKPTIRTFQNVSSAADLGDLFPGVHECVQSAFGDPNFPEEDVAKHVIGDHVLIVQEGSQVVGFSSLLYGSPKEVFSNPTLPDTQGIYFAGATVRKEAKGRGVYRQMNEPRISVALERQSPVIFTRTQNPLVDTSITRALERKIDTGEIADLHVTREPVHGCYGKMLTSELPPQSPDRAIQQAHDKLDVVRGDAYIVIYDITYNS